SMPLMVRTSPKVFSMPCSWRNDMDAPVMTYLTAPKVRPCTSCFWLNQPKTTMGAMAISEAADNLAQNRPSGLEYEAMSAASVPALAELRLSDQKASFQLSTRHRRPVDASPPMPSG